METLTKTNTYDMRMYLLQLIGYLQIQQRSFLKHGTVFTMEKSMVSSVNLIFDQVPTYELLPTIAAVAHDDSIISYASLKDRNVHALLDIVFGLFKPVYTELQRTGELPPDALFTLFILAVMAEADKP